MNRRKETIRKGLKIDFDLLDSDLVRCYIITDIVWKDGPNPRLVWMEYADRVDWTPGNDIQGRVMTRTLDDERELAEGRRLIRLMRYKSYACLTDLAGRKGVTGEFVIRKPPVLGRPKYVCDLDETRFSNGLGDPDSREFTYEDAGFDLTFAVEEAKRFTHAEAVRLTIRMMKALGYDIPGDHGEYYEPMPVDIAEELHLRATRRPRSSDAFHVMVNAIDREP